MGAAPQPQSPELLLFGVLLLSGYVIFPLAVLSSQPAKGPDGRAAGNRERTNPDKTPDVSGISQDHTRQKLKVLDRYKQL